MAKDQDDLLSSILGSADPGDQGTADEGGQDNDDLDTGPVGDEDQENDDTNLGDDNNDDNGEGDIGEGLEALAETKPKAKPEPKKKEPEGNQDDDDAGSGGDVNEADPFSPRAKVTTDRQGNVFHNGKIVAKAGREARMFMGFRKQAVKDRTDADKMAVSIGKISDGARQLLAQHEQLKNQKTLFDSAGMTAEEQAQLLPIAMAYKKNPIEGLKLMLTRAHMAGVDIKSLGGGGAIDPKILMDDMKAHFTELMKPVVNQTTESANQDKLRVEAEGFFQRNPDAKDVARFLGGSNKLGLILKEAKHRAPDVSMDELFSQLHYALLKQFKGQIPTGPVEKKPQDNPNPRRADRRMNRNFKSSVAPRTNNPSFDDIGKSVLRDIEAIQSRGQ